MTHDDFRVSPNFEEDTCTIANTSAKAIRLKGTYACESE